LRSSDFSQKNAYTKKNPPETKKNTGNKTKPGDTKKTGNMDSLQNFLS
jgi:hypothetical protein